MSITPESVRQLLNSDELGDRLRGANQIRTLDPAIAFELVQQAVQDSSARVRYVAVSQLAHLGNQDLPAALNLLRDRLLNDPEVDVQAAAADSLAALKLTDAFEDLRSVYQTTSEWLIKFSIIAALGEMGDFRGYEILQDALASGDDLVKTAAIGSLGELGDQRAIPQLRPYADHEDWQIRYRVVQALANLGGPEARSILETLVNASMESVAQEAKTYLQANQA